MCRTARGDIQLAIRVTVSSRARFEGTRFTLKKWKKYLDSTQDRVRKNCKLIRILALDRAHARQRIDMPIYNPL